MQILEEDPSEYNSYSYLSYKNLNLTDTELNSNTLSSFCVSNVIGNLSDLDSDLNEYKFIVNNS